MTFSTLLTLGAGLSLSAGFAALAVGDLNMISLAFAVLYIGLGVDFAIHYALRFRERMSGETTAPEAVRLAAADVGPALSLCAATTALGFFAFVPTAYAGVAELGLISGTSMFIGLVLSFTLLPGLLQIGPTPTPRHSQPALWRRWVAEPLARLPSRKGRPIRWISLTVAVASLLLLSRASFDFNPNNMRDPASESVTTFEDLLADPDAAPWTVSVLSDSAGVEGTVAALERLESVLEVRTVASFVPREQEPKLAILDRLAERFPDRAPPPGRITEGDLEDQVQAIRDLRDLTSFAASRTEGELSTTLGVLSRRLRRLLTALEARDPVTQASTLTSFNDLLLAGWSATMNDLFDSFRVAQLTSDNLPDEVNRQWVGGEGTRRLQVVPVEDLSDPSAMRRFVHDIFNVTTEATDLPVSYVEAGREIVRAFRLAFLGALGAIFLVLLLVLRRPDSVLLVLLPLGLAALVAGGITVLLGISFNFANIIVLPLLFGLGVDNGVHIFHGSARWEPAGVPSSSPARHAASSSAGSRRSSASAALRSRPTEGSRVWGCCWRSACC